MDRFSRTELLIGVEGIEQLKKARVAIFGIGGVGGYALEALARSGVGNLDLIDNDCVDITNINRQIIATTDTIGRAKVEVAKERILKINPEITVRTHQMFYLPETSCEFDFGQYDYIIDAIDTVSGKIGLVMQAQESKTPIISAMGAGNKLDPTAFEVTDIYKTSMCPLAKVMRRELKQRGVKKLKVVYSKEPPISPRNEYPTSSERVQEKKRQIPGSIAFVPSVVGLIIAGEVIKDLLKKKF